MRSSSFSSARVCSPPSTSGRHSSFIRPTPLRLFSRPSPRLLARAQNNQAPEDKKPKKKIEATLERPPPAGGLLWNSELLQGDLIMLTCTLLASSRVPIFEVPLMGGVMVAAWVAVATLKGDFTPDKEPNSKLSDLEIQGGWGMYQSILIGCQTWFFYTIICCGAWSGLYFSNIVQSDWWIDMGVSDFRGVPPFVETIVAQLLTMACWRALAAMFFKKEV